MTKLISFLEGKKTYIVAALIGITVALNQLGYIDDSASKTILELLTGTGLAALRLAVKK
jgi:hypothetical protein